MATVCHLGFFQLSPPYPAHSFCPGLSYLRRIGWDSRREDRVGLNGVRKGKSTQNIAIFSIKSISSLHLPHLLYKKKNYCRGLRDSGYQIHFIAFHIHFLAHLYESTRRAIALPPVLALGISKNVKVLHESF